MRKLKRQLKKIYQTRSIQILSAVILLIFLISGEFWNNGFVILIVVLFIAYMVSLSIAYEKIKPTAKIVNSLLVSFSLACLLVIVGFGMNRFIPVISGLNRARNMAAEFCENPDQADLSYRCNNCDNNIYLFDMENGKELMSEDITGFAAVKRINNAEYISCIDKQTKEIFPACEYESGKPVTMTYQTVSVSLFELQNSELIQEETFKSEKPKACPIYIFWENGVVKNRGDFFYTVDMNEIYDFISESNLK